MSQCQFVPYTMWTGMGFCGERSVTKYLKHGRAPLYKGNYSVLKMRICNHYNDWSNVQNVVTDKLKSV